MSSVPIIIWWFKDGKAGHENQAYGLIEAMGELKSVCVFQQIPLKFRELVKCYWGYTPQAWQGILLPDILIGAGSKTHPTLCVARYHYRKQYSLPVKNLVLMRPNFPLHWFDLCIIPKHDLLSYRNTNLVYNNTNILVTFGVLNRLRPSNKLIKNKGLFLIGGLSTHFYWDEDRLFQQINSIITNTPEINWSLFTSRRTPSTFISKCQKINSVLINPTHNLQSEIELSMNIWITSDSMSMIYEAMTVGSKVGILEIPIINNDRISQHLNFLMSNHYVTSFTIWKQLRQLSYSSLVLNEAVRCADLIIKKWFA